MIYSQLLTVKNLLFFMIEFLKKTRTFELKIQFFFNKNFTRKQFSFIQISFKHLIFNEI